jgi:hypothetical protein
MSFVDDFENTVMNAILGATSSLLPDPIYIGLSTTTPGDDGTGFTEPAALDGYARVMVANDGAEWAAAIGGEKSNTNAIVFPTATGSWGTVSHFGVFTAISGGTPKITGALDTPRPIGATDQFRFQATKLKVDLD